MRDQIRRPWRAALLLAVGALGGGAAWAVAGVPGSNGVIHACVQATAASNGTVPVATAPNITIIDPAAGQQCGPAPSGEFQGQTELDWNATGPTGPAGINGTNGTPGKTVTITRGPTYTINFAPPIRPGAPALGSASLAVSGGRSLGFNVLGYSFGAATKGKVNLHDFAIIKKVDMTSASLFAACSNGKHFPTVTINANKQSGGGKQKYLVIKLQDAVITSVQSAPSGGAGNTTPTETITFTYSRIEVSYK